MNVTYRCSSCENTTRRPLDDQTAELRCPACGTTLDVPANAVQSGQVRRCVVCPSDDLFVRKDFPQRLGVAIVVIGFAASCYTWFHHQVFWTFAILFATAAVDVILYFCVGNVLACYGCHSEYRGVVGLERHDPFDLETHERHRQRSAREKQAAAP